MTSQSWTTGSQGLDDRTEGAIRELILDLPNKQDIQDMASSIVSALSLELQDLRKQVEKVEERVTDLVESSLSTENRLFALEADKKAICQQFIDV